MRVSLGRESGTRDGGGPIRIGVDRTGSERSRRRITAFEERPERQGRENDAEGDDHGEHA